MGGFWDPGDHDGPDLPPGRRSVICVCCPAPGCHRLDVTRERSVREIAYWICNSCGFRWREEGGIGKNSVKQAGD